MEYKQSNDYEILYLINDDNEMAYGIIFSKYKPIISHFARELRNKFYNIGVEYDDLYQEGMIGLNEAIKKYNTNNSNTFYTLAILCIKREMQRLIIHSTRGKNILLNNAKSIDDFIFDNGLTLEETIYDERQIIDFYLKESNFYEYFLNIKYKLNVRYMPIFELKINGFSNTEISILLDIPYKRVDNALYNIKKCIKKILNITV